MMSTREMKKNILKPDGHTLGTLGEAHESHGAQNYAKIYLFYIINSLFLHFAL